MNALYNSNGTAGGRTSSAFVDTLSYLAPDSRRRPTSRRPSISNPFNWNHTAQNQDNVTKTTHTNQQIMLTSTTSLYAARQLKKLHKVVLVRTAGNVVLPVLISAGTNPTPEILH